MARAHYDLTQGAPSRCLKPKAGVARTFMGMKDSVMNQVSGADTAAAGGRSTGELVRLLTEQVSTLVRDELKLAQLEMTRKGKEAGTGIGLTGAGGLIALYGVACLIGCAIIAISHVIAAWLAALIVGAALLVIAA